MRQTAEGRIQTRPPAIGPDQLAEVARLGRKEPKILAIPDSEAPIDTVAASVDATALASGELGNGHGLPSADNVW